MEFFDGWNPARRYLGAVAEGCVVGLVSYTDHREGLMVLTYLSVSEDYQGQGVASRLVAVFLEEARLRGLAVGVTSYEQAGELYLKPVLHRTARTLGVVLHEDWTAAAWVRQQLSQELLAA
jgi:GNAT superfamily N-acetyltransferase